MYVCTSTSGEAKVLLQTLDVLLWNFSIIQFLQKYLPGGRLVSSVTFYPFGQSCVYCCLPISGIVLETPFYCGCIKSHSFKNLPLFACSIPAHVLSKEFEMVLTFCGESKDTSHYGNAFKGRLPLMTMAT